MRKSRTTFLINGGQDRKLKLGREPCITYNNKCAVVFLLDDDNLWATTTRRALKSSLFIYMYLIVRYTLSKGLHLQHSVNFPLPDIPTKRYSVHFLLPDIPTKRYHVCEITKLL